MANSSIPKSLGGFEEVDRYDVKVKSRTDFEARPTTFQWEGLTFFV